MNKFFIAICLFVMALCMSLQAGEVRGHLTKVDGNKIELKTKKGRILKIEFDKNDVLLKGVEQGDFVRIIVREGDEDDDDDGC